MRFVAFVVMLNVPENRLANPPAPLFAVVLMEKALVLKFVLSHPAVSCVIPATTQVAHVRQNGAAALGPMPDAAQRERIAAAMRAL